MRLAWVMIVTVLLAATAASGQIAPPDAKRAERVAALIKWVKKEGRNSILGGPGAHELGLERGSGDLPAKRKAFQDDDTKIIYVVNLLQVDGKEVHILFRTTTSTTILWNVTQSGAIESVAVLPSPGPGRLGDPQITLLKETIAYLENEMQKTQH